MGEVATLQLQDSVDANWRGAFDLIVRPAGQRLQLEQTDGLVEPNYVTFSGDGGITLAELASIRALPDVEVAAPIAMIGNMRSLVGGPVVVRSDLPAEPTLFRVSVRATSSDGTREVLIQDQTSRILLGPADLSSDTTPLVTEFGSLSWGPEGLYVFLDALPAIATPIIAVDPTAEQELLGSTSSFLAALEAIAALPTQPIARDFDLSLIPAAFEDQRFFVSALSTDPGSASAERPVIPVAVSSTLFAPLTITLKVEQLGGPIAAYPDAADGAGRLALAAAEAGDAITDLGSFVLDASDALVPLQPPRLALVWPDSSAPEGSAASVSVSAELTAQLADRPDYSAITPRDGGADRAFSAEPVGLVDASGQDRSPPEAQRGSLRLGLETAYRDSRPATLPLLEEFSASGPLDRPFVFAPVAEFNLADLDLPDNPLNYVPFGAYAPPETRLVAGPDGGAVDPQLMTPTLNPRGFINIPPLAITDLRSAVALRGQAPIDVIRVRIGGVSRFDDGAIARVERVASSIVAMGFDVDIVAGSSPQPIELFVQEFGTDGLLRDFGWVEQSWSTLGAAQRVVGGLGSANWGLLFLSTTAALVFAGGIQLVQRAVRSSEMGVLAALGWSRRRILRWMMLEAVWAGGIVLVIGLLVWLLTGASGWLAPTFSLALALTLPTATLFGTSAALRRPPSLAQIWGSDVHTGASRLVPGVRSPVSYGLRAAATRPFRSLVIALTVGIAAAAAASGAAVLASLAASVGPTRMADAFSQILSPIQLGMLIAAVAGSAALGMMLLRMDRQARANEMMVLRACGWARRDMTRMLTVHRLAIGTPAAILAAGAGVLLSLALTGQPQLLAAALGPIGVILVLAGEARWSSR